MARTRSIDDVRAFFETAPGADDTPKPVDAAHTAPVEAPI
jgi:ATP-dependent DNA helicase DinG